MIVDNQGLILRAPQPVYALTVAFEPTFTVDAIPTQKSRTLKGKEVSAGSDFDVFTSVDKVISFD